MIKSQGQIILISSCFSLTDLYSFFFNNTLINFYYNSSNLSDRLARSLIKLFINFRGKGFFNATSKRYLIRDLNRTSRVKMALFGSPKMHEAVVSRATGGQQGQTGRERGDKGQGKRCASMELERESRGKIYATCEEFFSRDRICKSSDAGQNYRQANLSG